VDATTSPAGGPAAWRTVATDLAGPTAISCATITLCVATDYVGNVLTSTRPTVKGSWKIAHVDRAALTGISCPSVSLCVAVDLAGNALSSTRPTSGSTSWTLTSIDRAGTYNPLSVSCPSTRLCVAVDQTGHALMAAPPTAARIRRLLAQAIVPRPGKITIKELRTDNGYTFSFMAPVTGNATINWYAAQASARRASTRSQPELVATGHLALTRSETGAFKLALTRQGARLLNHVKHLDVTAHGTFTATNGAPVSTTSHLTLS